jgi:hypothetical protein
MSELRYSELRRGVSIEPAAAGLEMEVIFRPSGMFDGVDQSDCGKTPKA